MNLLEEAKSDGLIRSNVVPELCCKLFLKRLELVLYRSENLFDRFSKQEILEHLVINNIRGIATMEYLKEKQF